MTEKPVDEDTTSGVTLGALAKSSNEKHRDFANHLVLNAYRLHSSNKVFVEIREILGTKKYMNQESVTNAVFEAKGGARSRSNLLATAGGAGNQATSSRSGGITRARSRRPRLRRSRLGRTSR